MCVCMSLCVRALALAFMCQCAGVCVCVCACSCMYVCARFCVSVCVCVCVSMRAPELACACVCVCVCVLCVYRCVCVCVCARARVCVRPALASAQILLLNLTMMCTQGTRCESACACMCQVKRKMSCDRGCKIARLKTRADKQTARFLAPSWQSLDRGGNSQQSAVSDVLILHSIHNFSAICHVCHCNKIRQPTRACVSLSVSVIVIFRGCMITFPINSGVRGGVKSMSSITTRLLPVVPDDLL